MLQIKKKKQKAFNIRGKFTFLEAIADKPKIHEQHKEQWKILANVNKIVSTKNATKQQREKGARQAELFTEK